VGEVGPGASTPNVVVFEEESEIFAPDLFPVIRFGAVVEYHAEQQKYLPEVADMTDDNPGDKEVQQIRQVVPIPTKWVPLFMDNPSLGVAIKRMSVLVDKLATQAELDFYAPYLLMMALRRARATVTASSAQWPSPHQSLSIKLKSKHLQKSCGANNRKTTTMRTRMKAGNNKGLRMTAPSN
jgi:hypothetical protein